jgi:hypothetical protein
MHGGFDPKSPKWPASFWYNILGPEDSCRPYSCTWNCNASHFGSSRSITLNSWTSCNCIVSSSRFDHGGRQLHEGAEGQLELPVSTSFCAFEGEAHKYRKFHQRKRELPGLLGRVRETQWERMLGAWRSSIERFAMKLLGLMILRTELEPPIKGFRHSWLCVKSSTGSSQTDKIRALLIN